MNRREISPRLWIDPEPELLGDHGGFVHIPGDEAAAYGSHDVVVLIDSDQNDTVVIADHVYKRGGETIGLPGQAKGAQSAVLIELQSMVKRRSISEMVASRIFTVNFPGFVIRFEQLAQRPAD